MLVKRFHCDTAMIAMYKAVEDGTLTEHAPQRSRLVAYVMVQAFGGTFWVLLPVDRAFKSCSQNSHASFFFQITFTSYLNTTRIVGMLQ